MIKKSFLFSLIGLFLFFPVAAQEEDNLDNLFDAPPEDIVVEEPEEDLRTLFEETDSVDFGGSFSTSVIAGGGLLDWSFGSDSLKGSVGLETDLKLYFDARPSPELRIYGSLITGFNPLDLLEDENWSNGDEAWEAPEINDLYADYIIKDFLFTRFGKFDMSWGQARLFKTGDLMAVSSDSYFNARLSFPTWFGLSFVMMTNDSLSFRDFSYGLKADFVIGETLISPAVKYNYNEGFHTLLSLKQVIGKTDLFVDFTTNFFDVFNYTSVVAGFYREWDAFKFYGEYRYSWIADGLYELYASDTDPGVQLGTGLYGDFPYGWNGKGDGPGHTHLAGLVVKWDNPFGAPFDLGLQFQNYFSDWSGVVTLGLTQKILPYLRMNIGLPIIYGADDSWAMQNNEDPEGRRVALALEFVLKADF